MGTLLIVDDDPRLRQSFEKLLTAEGHTVLTAPNGESALKIFQANPPDMVIMDIRMPGLSGIETFKAMHRIDPKLPVIIMTAYGTTETAIETTKMGAFDYVLKPFEIPDILTLIDQALAAGRFMHSQISLDMSPDKATGEAIIGKSRVMQEVYKSIGRVAPTDATVLLRGDSGTGKELVARALYQHSLRSNKPFLIINCVAIPETLLESELFGYEKGAFTGAINRKVGKIEQAHGGTVFLDEIGDMPFSTQAKILRLLQEKNIERLGGRETIPVNVRIIAATNRDLEAALATGRFREDLYYRLKVVTLWLPALRDRTDDIPLLTDYFLGRFARDLDLDNPGLTVEARTLLLNHQWPGNVRELANVLQKALIFSRGYPIRPEEISQAIGAESGVKASQVQDAFKTIRNWIRQELITNAPKNSYDTLKDRFAGLIILEALHLTHGNRTQAAKILGLSRPTLQAKIEKYKVKVETSVKSETS